MSLLVSLGRETEKLDLGTHVALEVTFDELRIPNGRTLARHLHNRWLPEDDSEPYATLEIVGPLVVEAAEAKVLGPYQNFSMFDGVGYVERRVFAFTDLQQKDWYVHDLGVHRPIITMAFHRTGP